MKSTHLISARKFITTHIDLERPAYDKVLVEFVSNQWPRIHTQMADKMVSEIRKNGECGWLIEREGKVVVLNDIPLTERKTKTPHTHSLHEKVNRSIQVWLRVGMRDSVIVKSIVEQFPSITTKRALLMVERNKVIMDVA